MSKRVNGGEVMRAVAKRNAKAYKAELLRIVKRLSSSQARRVEIALTECGLAGLGLAIQDYSAAERRARGEL